MEHIKCLILGSTGTLVTDHVGPSAAQARGAHSLVGIDHDVMLGGLLNAVLVMIDDPLAIVILATGQDVSHIAALDGVIAQFVHQRVGLLKVALIVAGAGRRLMMHHQTDAPAVGIVVQHLDIKVGIGCHKVKHIVLAIAIPVFPALVPALDQQLVKAIIGCKINVALHVLVVGSMAAIGLEAGIIRFYSAMCSCRQSVPTTRPYISQA